MTKNVGRTGVKTSVAFGMWLKQRRQEQGISPNKFADLINCSTIALLKIEAGERRPSREIAEQIADQIQIPHDEKEAFVAFARRGQAPQWGRQGASEIGERSPWRAAHSQLSNLPSVLTTLVGREADIEKAQSLILHSKVHLVTLTGAPGIGKTRLALQVATNLIGNFKDGVFLVELAPVSDPELLWDTIARALRLKHEIGQSIEDILTKFLSEQHMLLLLDNFEHLIDAAHLVVKLLEMCPWVKVLTTSREPLRLNGEKRMPVPPLSTPDGQHTLNQHEVAGYSAVELFVGQAEAVAHNFKLTEENAADVAAICRELEGLPLAIELAATRIDQYSPAQIRQELESGWPEKHLGMLVGGANDLPPRQRTLRNAIGWSYELLDAEEQSLFRRLGVFVGGFTPEAIGSVCPGNRPALARLLSLVEKSLLFRLSSEGNERFGMLESIREYVLEQLNLVPQEAEEARRLHALYFMSVAEEADAKLIGSDQKEWIEVLEKERDNLRAALRWASRISKEDSQFGGYTESPGAVEIALRTSTSLRLFSVLRGYIEEEREQLEIALALPTGANPMREIQRLRSLALRAAGEMNKDRGNFSAAQRLFEEGLKLSREVGDQKQIGRTLHVRGMLAYEQGDFDTARVSGEEALSVSRELGLKSDIAMNLTHLGLVSFMQNNYATSRELQQESLRIHKRLGNIRGIGLALNNLGLAIYGEGDYTSAFDLFNECLVIMRELGYKWGAATALINLGLIAFMQSDYKKARSLFEESLVIYREIGNARSAADALGNLSMVELVEGKYDAARKLGIEALTILKRAGDNYIIAAILIVLAGTEAGSGDSQRAAVLLASASSMLEKMGTSGLPEHRKVQDYATKLTRENLGEGAFLQAPEKGRSLNPDEAVAFALSELEQ